MATLENKVALVTGATSGIGKAAALALGTAGAKVVFSGRRDQEGLEPGVILDYDKDGNVVGIEILKASKQIKNFSSRIVKVETA